MDVDVFPDLTAPTVVVMTDAHGMAPEEVERMVTFPTLAPQSSVMGEMFFIGIQADSSSMMDLRTIADWSVKPMLLATGGVSQVTIIGGDYKQYQVLADPQKMKFYDVTISDLTAICQTISRNSTGGAVRQFGNEYLVRGMARSSDPDELGNSFVKEHNGKPVRLNDVCEVQIGGAIKMGYASENATPSVILAISKQPKTNTVDLTRRIEANLANLKKTLPADVRLDTHIFRQADFIETSVNNVKDALLEGSLTLSVVCKPGASLEESNRLGNLVETELLSIPEVSSTARRTGRGELDEHSQTVNSAEVDVNFTIKDRPREEFMADVRKKIAGIPGIAATVGQPLGHRIDHWPSLLFFSSCSRNLKISDWPESSC
jgi:Cu/Ag efflux pump CusA